MDYNKFKIKKNIWSLKGDYKIYDEHEHVQYYVKGENPFLRSKFSFCDSDDEVLFNIRRKLLSLRHTFYIAKDGIDVIKIVKTLGIRPKIFVEHLIDPDAFYVEGNIWGLNYKFYQGGEEFAMVSKDLWKLIDTYGVVVKQDADESLVLAVVTIINIIKDIQESRG